MRYKKAWAIMFIVYALDSLIITPYALWKGVATEVGLLMKIGYERIGLIWFPLWTFIFGLILLTFLELSFFFFDKTLEEKSFYPKYVLVILWVILMTATIIHNIYQVI